MARTLITVTPVNTANEEQIRELLPDCITLTQQAGPWPIARITDAGNVAYLLKVFQMADRILIAPVIDGEVQSPQYCYKIDSAGNAVVLQMSVDAVDNKQFNITLRPATGFTFLHQARMKVNRNAAQQIVSPKSALQVGVIRSNYGAQNVETAVEFIGTVDTRPGRALSVFGKEAKIWIENDFAIYEWNTL